MNEILRNIDENMRVFNFRIFRFISHIFRRNSTGTVFSQKTKLMEML
jgi:hypothetical protein